MIIYNTTRNNVTIKIYNKLCDGSTKTFINQKYASGNPHSVNMQTGDACNPSGPFPSPAGNTWPWFVYFNLTGSQICWCSNSLSHLHMCSVFHFKSLDFNLKTFNHKHTLINPFQKKSVSNLMVFRERFIDHLYTFILSVCNKVKVNTMTSPLFFSPLSVFLLVF